MSRSSLTFCLPVAAAVAFCLAGCGPTANKTVDNKQPVVKHDHDHDHAHDHPAKGPHEGHLVELDNKEEHHAEWVKDDSGKVTIYILDGAAKKEIPIAAESVLIKTKVGEKMDEFELLAMERTTGESPTAFKFETTSKELAGKLDLLGKEVTATLHVDVNGTMKEGKIEHADEGHDHGHKH